MARRLALTSRWYRGRMEGRDSKDEEYDRNSESEDAKRQESASLFCRLFFVVRHCSPQGQYPAGLDDTILLVELPAIPRMNYA